MTSIGLGTSTGSGVASQEAEPATLSLPDRDYSSLWYALMIRPWTSLGVVSAEAPHRAWALVEKLVETARLPEHDLKAVSVLDASADRAAAIAHAIAPRKGKAASQKVRFLVATDSPLADPAALRVLGCCDVVLLLVERGQSDIRDLRRTLALIGPERVLGAVFAQQ